jgi:hypothetical protein
VRAAATQALKFLRQRAGARPAPPAPSLRHGP